MCVSKETLLEEKRHPCRKRDTFVIKKDIFSGKETPVSAKRHFWSKRDICEESVLKGKDRAEFRLCLLVKVEKVL